VCSNPSLSGNGALFITVTPLHATDNDGYVLLNPTDTPSTWVTGPNETAEDRIAELETALTGLEARLEALEA